MGKNKRQNRFDQYEDENYSNNHWKKRDNLKHEKSKKDVEEEVDNFLEDIEKQKNRSRNRREINLKKKKEKRSRFDDYD